MNEDTKLQKEGSSMGTSSLLNTLNRIKRQRVEKFKELGSKTLSTAIRETTQENVENRGNGKGNGNGNL